MRTLDAQHHTYIPGAQHFKVKSNLRMKHMNPVSSILSKRFHKLSSVSNCIACHIYYQCLPSFYLYKPTKFYVCPFGTKPTYISFRAVGIRGAGEDAVRVGGRNKEKGATERTM